ncbi:MAG: TlpA disulfide reductase family protein [Rhodospirillales bacterium]
MFHIKVSPNNRLLSGALLLVGVIFLISPALASGDPDRCAVNDDALKAIVPAKTPIRPAAVEFFKADGSTLTLDDFRGRGVILNFWATWCAPCVREMPELDALNASLKKDGIDVLAVSTDRAGHSAIAGFYEQNGIRNLASLHDPKSSSARTLGVRGLPTTLIINPDGFEVARIVGIHHYDTPESHAYFRRCIGPEQ